MPDRRRVLTRVLTVLALSGLYLPQAPAQPDDDARLRERIAGRWASTYEPPASPDDARQKQYVAPLLGARGLDHYRTDGTVEGTSLYRFADRQERMSYQGRWRIEAGDLYIEVDHSDSHFLPPGTQTRDRIVELSKDRMRLEAEDGTVMELERAPD